MTDNTLSFAITALQEYGGDYKIRLVEELYNKTLKEGCHRSLDPAPWVFEVLDTCVTSHASIAPAPDDFRMTSNEVIDAKKHCEDYTNGLTDQNPSV